MRAEIETTLREIAGAAQPLSERLGDARVACDSPRDRRQGGASDEVVRKRLDAWCQACAKGDWELFARRLAIEGLDLDGAREAVAPRGPLTGELPPWSETLRAIVERLGSDVDEDGEPGVVEGERFILPERPIPFEDILGWLVLEARARLRHATGDLNALLSSKAHAALERNLLEPLNSRLPLPAVPTSVRLTLRISPESSLRNPQSTVAVASRPRQARLARLEVHPIVRDQLEHSPLCRGQTAHRSAPHRALLRAEKVMLRGRWWRMNAGALVAFRKEDGAPVALLQPGPERYDLVDSEAGRIHVTEEVATGLEEGAYMFLPSFGTRTLSPTALWSLGRRGTQSDLVRVLLVSALGGALALATPVITQVLVDEVIPYSRHPEVGWIAGVLIVLGLATAALGLVRGLGMLRLETQMELNMEAALMDRLLRLPSRFFREYDSGALAERVLGIVAIRKAITGSQLVGVLSGLFSVVSLGVIFYYDARLALLASALGLVIFGVILAGSLVGLKYRRKIEAARGELSGLLLQLLSGISKLRVGAAERRAFREWAQRFVHLQRLTFRAGTIENGVGVFGVVFPMVSSILFYTVIYRLTVGGPGGETDLSTGAFFATITALTHFLAGLLGLGGTVVSILGVVPQYERLKPILEASLEARGDAIDPGDLTGAVEVSDVTFRYDEAGPVILEDVNVDVCPGEMVALVGPSGSGKSTLLRLLLGLERPDAGRVIYDGLDLADLDIEAVRGQIGVVLQGGHLSPGDLLSNIVGHWNFGLEDAWEAVRKVGLEEDIRAMPMQMHTPVGDAMSTFSTGQQQRVRIARAIIHGPPLLYLDEATSALDNRVQSVVAESLAAMKMTRVVIAHRLSTIQHADRIYYLDRGRVIESGDYDALMKRNGPFAALAKRQLVESGD